MRNLAYIVIAIGMKSGCATAGTPLDLDRAKKLLEAKVGGAWEIKPTSPDIGLMLRSTTLPAPLTAGFFGILPYAQDEVGKKKVDLYMSTCSAPLYVLGFNHGCTVITWLPRDNSVALKVFDALALKRPSTVSGVETKVNRPRTEKAAEQGADGKAPEASKPPH